VSPLPGSAQGARRWASFRVADPENRLGRLFRLVLLDSLPLLGGRVVSCSEPRCRNRCNRTLEFSQRQARWRVGHPQSAACEAAGNGRCRAAAAAAVEATRGGTHWVVTVVTPVTTRAERDDLVRRRDNSHQ